MELQGAYEVHITDRGPAARPFAWAIVQCRGRQGEQAPHPHVVARSTQTFATPGEAIADAALAPVWRDCQPA